MTRGLIELALDEINKTRETLEKADRLLKALEYLPDNNEARIRILRAKNNTEIAYNKLLDQLSYVLDNDIKNEGIL